MKAELIYTSTTPELIQLVEQEVIKQLDNDMGLLNLEGASILAEVREAGYVTTTPAVRLTGVHIRTAEAGMDAALNLCFSVGGVVDCTQDATGYLEAPIARVDEEVCREAVRKGQKVAIMATLPTTSEPTENTINRVAREMDRHVELVDVLVDGSFGLDRGQSKVLMAEYAGKVAGDMGIILFAQDSMAYHGEYIADTYYKIVLPSPRFGAVALKETLIAKGVMQLKTYN